MNEDWDTITRAVIGTEPLSPEEFTRLYRASFERRRREPLLTDAFREIAIVEELPLRTPVHADPMQDLDDIIANDPNVVTSPRGSRMLSDLLGRVISVYRNRVAMLKARVLNAERYPALIYEDTVYRMTAGANGVEIHVAGELRLTIK